MRLAVFDTNVLVSAGINSAGAPGRLVLEWVLSGQVQTLICPWIASEYREVAWREKLARYGFPPRWLDYLIETSLELPDPPPWAHSLPDPKDAPFLSLARVSGAWLVTGNLKHFPGKFRGGAKVISPGDYLVGLRE